MKVYKIINIDLESERKRIQKHFTGEMRSKLERVVNLFELGKFQEALEYVQSTFKYDQKNECDEAEYIGMEIHQLLWEIRMGDKFTVASRSD